MTARIPINKQLEVLYNTPDDISKLNEMCLKILGKTLGYGNIIYIQDPGEKKQGYIYLDRNKQGLFYCTTPSSTTSNEASIFTDYSNLAIGNKLENLNNKEIKNIKQFTIFQDGANLVLPEDFIYYEKLLIIVSTDNHIHNISKVISITDFLLYNLITHHNNLGTNNLRWTIGSIFIQSQNINNIVVIEENSRISIYGINKNETNCLELLKSKLVKIKNNALSLLFYRNNDDTLSFIGHSCYGTNRIENSVLFETEITNILPFKMVLKGNDGGSFFREFSFILENNKIRTTLNNINFSYYSTDISDFKFLD